MNADAIERLLYEEEGTTLDFKRDVYQILQAQSAQWKGARAELIKDLLAFANANRREDAYLILGATKIPGQRAGLIGIAHEIDDATVQQIVNTKLNRHIAFSYRHITFEGKRLVVIHVPLGQARPLYVTKNSDECPPEGQVFIRRGSSTGIASPDEIHAMGKFDAGITPSPSIALSLWNPNAKVKLLNDVAHDLVVRVYPPLDQIPDYTEESTSPQSAYRFVASDVFGDRINHSYFREFAAYDAINSAVVPLSFVVVNESGVTANDVVVRLSISDPGRTLECIRASRIPKRPKKKQPRFEMPVLHQIGPIHDSAPRLSMSRDSANGEVDVTLILGKLQPRETVTLDNELFLGTSEEGERHVTLSGKIFGDNIAEPIPVAFSLNLRVSCERISVEQLTGRSSVRVSKTQTGEVE